MPLRVRYYCHLKNTGYGRAALEYALGLLERPDVELDLRPLEAVEITRPLDPLRGAVSPAGRGSDPDIVLIHTLPRDCGRVLAAEIAAGYLKAGTPAVAYTTWEALTFPAELAHSLLPFDKVMTPSAASGNPMAQAIVMARRATGDPRTLHPVATIPHAYNPVAFEQRRAAANKVTGDGSDDIFTFYFIGAPYRRKNIDGLIRAFVRAFPPKEQLPVQLIVHSPGMSQAKWRSYIAATGYDELRNVSLQSRPISEASLWRLHLEEGDVYVSASRGEAWNLPAFEALLAGRHIIVPQDQGTDEFLPIYSGAVCVQRYGCDVQLAAQDVEGEMTPEGLRLVVTGPSGLTAGDIWLEPKLVQLARAMREAFDDKTRTIRTIPVAPDSLRRFQRDVVAEELEDWLRDIIKRRELRERDTPTKEST